LNACAQSQSASRKVTRKSTKPQAVEPAVLSVEDGT
jgi:hypothetical protein